MGCYEKVVFKTICQNTGKCNWFTAWLCRSYCLHQAFSQNLESGHPGGMLPHKFVKALVHFSSFCPRIGRPQDTRMPKVYCTYAAIVYPSAEWCLPSLHYCSEKKTLLRKFPMVFLVVFMELLHCFNSKYSFHLYLAKAYYMYMLWFKFFFFFVKIFFKPVWFVFSFV